MGLFTLWWINIDPENKPFLVETNLPTPIWPCQEEISIDCMIFLLVWDVEAHILREFHPLPAILRLQLEALPEGFHNRYLAASEVEALQWMADALDARMEPWRYDVHSKIVWIYGCSMMFIIWWIVVLDGISNNKKADNDMIPPYFENDRYWPILRWSGGWESWLTYKHGGEKQGKRLGRTLSEFGIPTKMEVESSHAWRRATSLGNRGDEPFFPKNQRVKERTALTMVAKRPNDARLLGGVLYTANQFWGRHFCILVSLSGRVGLRQHNTGIYFFSCGLL